MSDQTTTTHSEETEEGNEVLACGNTCLKGYNTIKDGLIDTFYQELKWILVTSLVSLIGIINCNYNYQV